MPRHHTSGLGQDCRFLQTRQNQDDGQPRGCLLKWVIARVQTILFESSRHFVFRYPGKYQNKYSILLWKESSQTDPSWRDGDAIRGDTLESF